MAYDCFYTTKNQSKNISIKMLKDVEMTVPKSRETSACNNTGDEGSIFICSKTGSIYAARQGMRACNNNNMRNPSLHLFYYGVMHVIIVACPHPCLLHIYSSPVLLYINIWLHPLCCCIYILHLFLYFFWHCHPYVLQHFNGNVFTLFLTVFIQWSLKLSLQ